MKKYLYLIKNMGLLTISNFTTKFLSFFLVPLYTAVLSTSEYGTYDLFNTTISLLIPLLTIDIQEAVLRFSMDDDAQLESIWKIGFRYTFISCWIVLVGLVLNRIFIFYEVITDYEIEFLLLYSVTAFSGLLLYFTRGTGKFVYLSISGVLSSVIMIICNIVFLLWFKFGIHGYFWATIIGVGVQCIYLSSKLNLSVNCKFNSDEINLHNRMIEYSKPMVSNAISWWINTASDRYVVTWFCGIAVNGIYSVSYKIPSILSVLQGIFSQAWTLSATKEFDREDKKGFFINVYNTYNFFLIFACSVLLIFDKPLSKLLFADEFYQAWKCASFLLLSTIFSGLATFLGGILSALKKSNLFARVSIITAIVNTLLNIILVFFIGPIGAAISTLVAYCLMWALRLVQVKKFLNLKVNYFRDFLAYIILIIQALNLFVIHNNLFLISSHIIFLIVIVIMYKNVVVNIFYRIRKN